MPYPLGHALGAGMVGAVVFTKTKRWQDAATILGSGVLMDCDHLLDWWLSRPQEMLHTKNGFADFWRGKYGTRTDHRILLAHGWEFPPLLFVLSKLFKQPVISWLALGILTHLVLDHAFNKPKNPLQYSFLWRAFHGFKK